MSIKNRSVALRDAPRVLFLQVPWRLFECVLGCYNSLRWPVDEQSVTVLPKQFREGGIFAHRVQFGGILFQLRLKSEVPF